MFLVHSLVGCFNNGTCAQSMALGTRTQFQLEILTISVIYGIVYFRENILESSRYVSETTPWGQSNCQRYYVRIKLEHYPPLPNKNA